VVGLLLKPDLAAFGIANKKDNAFLYYHIKIIQNTLKNINLNSRKK